MRQGKGCSPEMASRIVGLLLADVGLARGVYPVSPTRPAPPPQQPAPQPAEPRQYHRRRKVTPDIAAHIRDAHGFTPDEVCTQVLERFGVRLSQGAVYKEWQSAHLARRQATPTPAP